jgi:hypothetical protein
VTWPGILIAWHNPDPVLGNIEILYQSFIKIIHFCHVPDNDRVMDQKDNCKGKVTLTGEKKKNGGLISPCGDDQ